MELYASPPVPIVTASMECLLHEPAAAGCPISPDIYGSTAQFGKSIRPKILPHTKVIKGREYCMYFPLL